MSNPDVDTEHKETDVVLQESVVEQQAEVPAQSHTENLADNKKGKVHRKRFKLPLPRLALLPTLLVLVCLVNAAGLAANIYARYRLVADAKKPDATLVIPKTKVAPDNLKTPAATITTLHYVSKALHVEFDYPVDWRISGSADDKYLSLSSAPFSIVLPDKTTDQGVIALSIDDNSDHRAVFSSYFYDTDVITEESELLTYTNPTAFQRKTSHISFESGVAPGQESQAVTNFIFVSGSLNYRKGQHVKDKDLTSIDPAILAYFNPCHFQYAYCQAMTTEPITQDEWQHNPNFAKLRTLLTSLRFTQ